MSGTWKQELVTGKDVCICIICEPLLICCMEPLTPTEVCCSPCTIFQDLAKHVDENPTLHCLLALCDFAPCSLGILGEKIAKKSGFEESFMTACMKGLCCGVCYLRQLKVEMLEQQQKGGGGMELTCPTQAEM